MEKNFIFLETIVENVKNGLYNDIILQSTDGVERAIVKYMFNNQCSIREVANYFQIEEEVVKQYIKNLALNYDKMFEEKNHESFSRRGR